MVFLDMNSDLIQVNLANSNSRLAHLQPKEQHVVGQDFSVSGPHDGHFCPETYFDVEVLTRGLVAVKMVWEWRDQVYFLLFLVTIFVLAPLDFSSLLYKPF